MSKCVDCYYFNAHHLTYISKKFDCCAYWHIAYHKFQNRRYHSSCNSFQSKNIQLTLFI